MLLDFSKALLTVLHLTVDASVISFTAFDVRHLLRLYKSKLATVLPRTLVFSLIETLCHIVFLQVDDL